MGRIYFKGIETPNIESCGFANYGSYPLTYSKLYIQGFNLSGLSYPSLPTNYDSFDSCFFLVLCSKKLKANQIIDVVGKFPVLSVIVYHRMLALEPYRLVVEGDWNEIMSYVQKARSSLDYQPGGEVPKIPITYYAKTHYFVREQASQMMGSWAVISSVNSVEELYQKTVPKNFLIGTFQTLPYIRPITEQFRFSAYLYAVRKYYEGEERFDWLNRQLTGKGIEQLDRNTYEMLKKSKNMFYRLTSIPVIGIGTHHASVCVVKVALWLNGFGGKDYHQLWTCSWARRAITFQKGKGLKNQKGVIDTETLQALGFKPIKDAVKVPGLPYEVVSFDKPKPEHKPKSKPEPKPKVTPKPEPIFWDTKQINTASIGFVGLLGFLLPFLIKSE